MKKYLVLILASVCIGLTIQPSFAETITIPVLVNKTIRNNGDVSSYVQLQYQWSEDYHWQSFFGFDLTGHLPLADIQSINSITFNVHETHTYYTQNDVHVYSANNDDWATGSYTYGAHGSSLGYKSFPAIAGCGTSGGCPVDKWYSYDVTNAASSLTDNGKLGLYLALPTKDDSHNYAFHNLEPDTAYLTIDYEPDSGHGTSTGGCTQAELDAKYQEGYNAAVQACKADPASCGILVSGGGGSTSTGDCISIGSDLSIPLSCAEYKGVEYGVTLEYDLFTGSWSIGSATVK